MQQPYKYSSDFFHEVLIPACEKMLRCSRGREKLAGTVAVGSKAHLHLSLPNITLVFTQQLVERLVLVNAAHF